MCTCKRLVYFVTLLDAYLIVNLTRVWKLTISLLHGPMEFRSALWFTTSSLKPLTSHRSTGATESKTMNWLSKQESKSILNINFYISYCIQCLGAIKALYLICNIHSVSFNIRQYSFDFRVQKYSIVARFFNNFIYHLDFGS